MSFAAIIGQNEVKKRLGSALTGEPGHAYVFTGPQGIGRTTLARAFAAALLCYQPSAEGACGQCRACHHFQNRVHADYRELRRENSDKFIRVEQVRRQICADLPLRPQFGSRKVYLLAADDLNEQGQNALLKSLEEPPPFVYFLMTVENISRLLSTIRSRVITVPLQRLTPQEISQVLSRRQLAEEQEHAFYARFAGGLPGVALDLAGSEWFGQLRAETLDLYQSLATSGRTKLLTDGYQFFDQNRSQAVLVLTMLGSLVRDQLVCLTAPGPGRLTNEDQRDMLLTQPVGKRDSADARSRLGRAHQALLSAHRGLAANASYEVLACQLLLTLRKELTHA